MGFWSDAKDMKNVIAFENSPHRDNIQEWDLLDQLAMTWKIYFEKLAKAQKTTVQKAGFNLEDMFDDAMNMTGTTPPAKLSGGCCTTRAVELFNKYGGGKGVPFGAAMREGHRLALGQKSAYPTKSKPRGCAG
jgi:hypothetical protein